MFISPSPAGGRGFCRVGGRPLPPSAGALPVPWSCTPFTQSQRPGGQAARQGRAVRTPGGGKSRGVF